MIDVTTPGHFHLLLITALAALASASPAPPDHPARAPDVPVDAPRRAADGTMPAEAKDGDPRALVRQADALMQRSRETAEPEEDHAEAEALYRQALEQHPGNPEALLGLAWVCHARHDFPRGDAWARRVLAAAPDRPEAHSLLGDAAVERGDYEQAFEHYQRALDLRPDLSACSRAARLLWLTGDGPQAAVLMRRAIEAGGPHPENVAWCRVELALMQFHSGDLADAQHQLDLALAAAPGNHRALAAMGRVMAASGKTEEAIRCYTESLAARPTHEALVALADLHVLEGRHGKAADFERRVLDFHRQRHDPRDRHGAGDDEHGHGNTELARFLADRGLQLDRALAEAEAAWRASKGVYAADTLAWCCHVAGKTRQAQALIVHALAQGTPDASLHFHAGMIHAQAGDIIEARRHLEAALDLHPRFHPRDAPLAAETCRALARAATALHDQGRSTEPSMEGHCPQ